MGPFRLWSCHLPFHKYASPVQEKAWFLVQSLWRWTVPSYPNTRFPRGRTCLQKSTFEKVTAPDFSLCSPNRNVAFNLILWHLFCSLISPLFVFSFIFCCYLKWENVPCAQLLLCSSRFRLTCILAAAFQLSYSGHNLNLCLQHHCQISYPFLKI